MKTRSKRSIKTDTESIRRLLMSNGRLIFGLQFIARTSGSIRTMNCQYDPETTYNYDPIQHKLINVIDTRKKQVRSVPLDGIRRIRMKGIEYQVTITNA